MLMVNRGSASISLADFGIEGRLEPGKVAELPDGYCLPRLRLNGSRQPSIVEEICPQLQPADPKEAEEVKKTPSAPFSAPPSLVQAAEELGRQGRPPAVIELLTRGARGPRRQPAKVGA